MSGYSSTTDRPALLRYGVAVLALALALLIRLPLQPLLGNANPFLFFFPAIMAAAWYGGFGPGLLATGLSAVAANFFFIPPTFSFHVPNLSSAVQIGIFGGIGVFISLLNERLHRARRGAEVMALESLRREEALRRVQREAVESEERFRITANSAPVMIWMSGTDQLCDWLNQSWLDFTGRALEEEIGSGWMAGIHPDDLERCIEIYSGSFDARRPFSTEYRLRRHDGEYRWLLDNGVPRYAPDGEFAGFIGTCLDIHDRKQDEQERAALLAKAEAAYRDADAANRSKDEFLATVSHELRTPLNAIMGWTQLLLAKGANTADDERHRRGLETVVRNAKLQAQLIDDLLDVSRIISGKMRLDVQPTDLAAVIDAAVEAIRPAAEGKQIQLRRVLDPFAGPVMGDPARLQQVVWNLLSNAVKFTPKGGKIEVRLERVNSHVEILVADTGAGITPEFLPHVFDRFRQLDASTTRRHGGLGLGLSIVRHLVELHGGTVRVKSPGEGEGSTFIVALPLSVAHLTPGEGARIHPRTEELAPADPCRDDPALDLRGIRVLVVDDEPDARETLQQILEHCNAEVRTVGSAAEAMKALESWRPDVLLSDIGMPGEDGYDLIRRVRELPAERGGRTPAAALTAFARGEDRRRALRAGFQMHVAKPVDLQELATVVASLARGVGSTVLTPPDPPSPPG
ncbi:MAG TPA: ATP-binding protein [Thermoanaerobaculia bacterium]|nr:ATP-binding protein [Thermoanaerobaculia bacterium]